MTDKLPGIVTVDTVGGGGWGGRGDLKRGLGLGRGWLLLGADRQGAVQTGRRAMRHGHTKGPGIPCRLHNAEDTGRGD